MHQTSTDKLIKKLNHFPTKQKKEYREITLQTPLTVSMRNKGKGEAPSRELPPSPTAHRPSGGGRAEVGTAAQAGSAAPHLRHTHEGLPCASDGGMVTGKAAERTE